MAKTTHHLYPPFPSDVPTAGLLSISLDELLSRSPEKEAEKLFAACRDIGFFYLDLSDSELGRSTIDEAERLHVLQQEFYALPHEEKDKYGQDKVDPFFAYRWTACEGETKDAWGRAGRREMYSLRADDFVGVRPHLPKHPLILQQETLLTSFARHCRQILHLLLSHLEASLHLPRGTLHLLHNPSLPSGDFITLQHRPHEPHDESQIRKGEYTDFGSITFLFNWLGGLQIRSQSSSVEDVEGEWVYVRPIPGTCIVNIADSLVRFTAGILKSNIHRVAPAPGQQGGLPRYSLTYFAHPNDEVVLVPVKGGMVGEAARGVVDDGVRVSAREWVERRSLGDLRGVYTFRGGIERRELDDAVPFAGKAAS